MLSSIRHLVGRNPTIFFSSSSVKCMSNISALPKDETDDKTKNQVIRTMKRDIRGSPRKLGLLATQIRGLPVEEALIQMKFSQKRKSRIVQKTIQNAVNLAEIDHGLQPQDLEIAHAVVGKGKFLKRLRIMGRGRSGTMHRPFSHLTIELREMENAKKQKRKKYWPSIDEDTRND